MYWKAVGIGLAMLAVLGQGARLAIAGNEIKNKVDQKTKQYDQALIDIAQIAKKVERHIDKSFLWRWLRAHGKDSVVVDQWTKYPRSAPRDGSGSPLIDVSFLDPDLLPERGVLLYYAAPDSLVRGRELWHFPVASLKAGMGDST